LKYPGSARAKLTVFHMAFIWWKARISGLDAVAHAMPPPTRFAVAQVPKSEHEFFVVIQAMLVEIRYFLRVHGNRRKTEQND